MNIFQKLEVVESIITAKNKFDLITTLCANKNVLHVGCSDAPVTNEKIISNEFLHFSLLEKAANVVGLDLSLEGLEIMRKYGIKDLIHADASELSNVELPDNFFDVVVAGDILEHMSNVGGFLDSVKKKISSDGKIVITVPNAFYYYRILKIAFGIEIVHKDHVYYFSPKVLINLIRRHGYRVEGLYFFKNSDAKKIEKLFDFLFFNKFRYYSHSIGLVISVGEEYENKVKIMD